MHSKGFSHFQIFVLVLTSVIALLLFFFGYKSIIGVKDSADNVQLVKTENEIKSKIKELSQNYGSVKIETFKVPLLINQVCIIDTEKKEELLIDNNLPPLILNSINSDTDYNFFFFGEITRSFYAGEIRMQQPYYKCLNINSGLLELTINGVGKAVEIS